MGEAQQEYQGIKANPQKQALQSVHAGYIRSEIIVFLLCMAMAFMVGYAVPGQ